MISSFEFEHESHGRGRKAGVGIQQRDHGRHVGAADRNDQQHAEDQRHANDDRKEHFRFGMQHQVNGAADGHDEQEKVDEVLPFIGDRPLRQNLLQLSRGHQAAGKSQASEDDFHRQHRHHELGNVRACAGKTRRCRPA